MGRQSTKSAKRMIRAIESNNLGKLKKLLNKVSPNTFYHGMSPLHISSGLHSALSAKVCQLLLESGADVNLKSVYDSYTPLHIAVIRSNDQVVKVLLSNGADVYECDNNGNNAFVHARQSGNFHLLHDLSQAVLQQEREKRKLERGRRLRRMSSCSGISEYYSCSSDDGFVPGKERRRRTSSNAAPRKILNKFKDMVCSNFVYNQGKDAYYKAEANKHQIGRKHNRARRLSNDDVFVPNRKKTSSHRHRRSLIEEDLSDNACRQLESDVENDEWFSSRRRRHSSHGDEGFLEDPYFNKASSPATDEFWQCFERRRNVGRNMTRRGAQRSSSAGSLFESEAKEYAKCACMSDNELKRQLERHGVYVGFINVNNRFGYVKKLVKLKKELARKWRRRWSEPEHKVVEIIDVLETDIEEPENKTVTFKDAVADKSNLSFQIITNYCSELEEVIYGRISMSIMERTVADFRQAMSEHYCATTVAGQPKPKKSHFVYMLLDPRQSRSVFQNSKISSAERFSKFLDSIFYVGKGKKSRPFQHLVDARSARDNGMAGQAVKHEKICNIWEAGYGVSFVQCFHNLSSDEAFTREALMIKAINVKNLTNIRHGSVYGSVREWSESRQRLMGSILLNRSFQIFLADAASEVRASEVEL